MIRVNLMEQDSQETVELDVRPYLRKNLEPFQVIMDTVKTLKKDQMLKLHATFKPTPLLEVMKTKGFIYKTEKLAKEHWIVTFIHQKYKHLLHFDIDTEIEKQNTSSNKINVTGESSDRKIIELDNRDLEPPEPMMRTLSVLERIRPGDEVHIHNDRVPVFLIEELNNLGYPFTVDEQLDGSVKVQIQKK